tara:strand:+ start:2138 stop:2836 length:699 start_codon:yes stop_codon:yes gene_type:complete
MSAELSAALETRDLTKIYGEGNTRVVAMEGVSLRIERGQVVALLGPSGSGKSTFLMAVGLITPPTSGQIWVGGELIHDGQQALTDLRAFRRLHMGFVFQKSNLIPFLRARENVQVALELNGHSSGEARRRAEALLEEFGIGDRSEHYPTELSGGQQQRVAVARAIANQPALILADEPTAALDSHRGRQVMELFREIAHERGSAAIVVTHDQRALDVFDAIYEMEDGRIAQAR